MSMTSQDAVLARQRLELSVEDLSAQVGLTPDVVQAWETGNVRVPARAARQLQWQLALLDRSEALAKSGLPECAWMAAWDEEEIPNEPKAEVAHMDRADEHMKSCSVCKAREQFVRERFGEMPRPPMPPLIATFGWIANRLEKLPEWGRPAVWVGLAFGSYTMLRIIAMIPAMLREPRLAVTALTGLAASLAIGVSLGLVYGGFGVLRSTWTKRATGRPS